MPPDQFHNPYHFIPADEGPRNSVPDPLRCKDIPDATAFRTEGPAGRLRHDAYEGFSGRILCRIDLETPLVVGGQQKPSADDYTYTLVEPYTFQGEPTIPATALKGMLSSLMEAASQSALRVLENRPLLSFRQPMPGLSALGIIVADPGTRSLRLKPLTAPNMFPVKGGGHLFADPKHDTSNRAKDSLWRQVFAGYVNARVYIGRYTDDSEARFAAGLPVKPPAMPPIPRQDPFYMPVWPGGSVDALEASLPFTPRRSKKGGIVIGQSPNDPTILTQAEYARRRDAGGDVSAFVRGFIRILGVEGRSDIPNTKRHELFIPCPETLDLHAGTLPIPKPVLAAFNLLAAERSDDQDARARKTGETVSRRARLPYTPFGTESEEVADRPDDVRLHLRPGHIVYFDVAADETGAPFVSALSFSAIWRGGVGRPDRSLVPLWDFFDPEKRPFNSERTTVTPAEWLFGFVSAEEKPTTATPYVAYKGRLRISLGRLAKSEEKDEPGFFEKGAPVAIPPNLSRDCRAEQKEPKDRLGDRVRLKTLGSPKPPSPQLYFTSRAEADAGTAIAKEALSLDAHKPQGRKAYLHQKPDGKRWQTRLQFGDGGDQDEEKKQARLRNAVPPIAPKDAAGKPRSFWFHIDFDNLSGEELKLVCFALQPSPDFRHKLGMGKGLGLGSIHINPQAIALIDRPARYRTETDLFHSTRYAAIVHADTVAPASWPKRFYARETTEAGSRRRTDLPTIETLAALMRGQLEHLYPRTISALLKIGEGTRHHQEQTPVHPPLAGDQPPGTGRDERETYRWFTNNAESIRQALQNPGHADRPAQWEIPPDPQQLAPIPEARTARLPVLRRNARPCKRQRRH